MYSNNGRISIWNIIDWIFAARDIKKDPEKRRRSKRFGVQTIACAVCTALVSCLMLLIKAGQGELFTMVLGIAGGILAIACFIGGLISWFFQLYVNRSAFTWISLACLLASLIVPVLILTVF